MVGFALVAWMICGRCEYVVSVPCHLAPTVTRDISMPFEGILAATFVKPGDQVQAGELLATLDRRNLSAEREGILAELQIANVSLVRAASEKDLASAAQAQAQVEIAESHLKVIDDQLQRTEIRAPTAGQILTGDLRPRVGEVITVGERLIEFAPLGSWKIELQIPEYAAPYVSPGQLGSFATNARPDESSVCRLLRLQPSTEVAGGKNVFTAEATLDATPPEWVRAGMEGVARIRTEEHPIWWVWLHRVIDTIRLQLWRL